MYGGSLKDTGYIPPPMVSSAPSWYLRIDGGYAAYDEPVMVEDGVLTLTDTNIDGNWNLGGGVGRYFSDSIRGDLTYEHRFDATVEGTDRNGSSGAAGTRQFGLASDVFLANLYYDFDAFSRFSPYLGVGLGFVRHSAKEGTIEGCNCNGLIQAETKTDVAAALMAGATIKLFRQFKLDAGYRFLYMGSATSGPLTANNVTADDPTVEDIRAHEVRFGLRYDFN